MPGIIGSTGWDRSSAWMPDFSSTHSTTAFSGGLWYRPATSTTFSTKNGSDDSLKVPAKCGLRSNFRQIRPVVDLLSPLIFRQHDLHSNWTRHSRSIAATDMKVIRLSRSLSLSNNIHWHATGGP